MGWVLGWCGREDAERRDSRALRLQVLRGGATSAAAGGGALLALLLYCDLVNAQLPSMTLKYITKLVLRSDHRSVVCTRGGRVAGGATPRVPHLQSLESSVGSVPWVVR